MQQRISGDGEIPKLPPITGQHGPKTSQALFSTLVHYLEKQGQVGNLRLLVAVMESLQKEQGLSAETQATARGKPSELGEHPLLKQLNTLFANGSRLQNYSTQLQQAMKNKDNEALTKTLKQMAKDVLDPEEFALLPETADAAEATFAPLLQQGQLGEKLVMGRLAAKAAAAKQAGKDPEEAVNNKLNAMTSGKTPFTKSALNVKASLQTSQGQQTMKSLKENPAKVQGEQEKSADKAAEEAAATSQAAVAKGASQLAQATSPATSFKTVNEQSQALAQTLAQASVQAGVKKEIEKLLKLLAMLKASGGDPNAIAQIQQMLAGIEQDYPNLTAADLNNLTAACDDINAMEGQLAASGKMSPHDQIQFLEKEVEDFTDISATVGKSSAEIKKLIAGLQAQLKSLQQAQDDIATLEQFLQEIASGKTPSKADMTKFLAALQDLMKNYGSLPPSIQQAVSSVTSQLSQIMAKCSQPVVNASLAQITGDMQIAAWTEQYYQQHQPTPTVAGLKTFINAQIAAESSNPAVANDPFFKALIQTEQTDVNASGFPGSQGVTGISFGTVSGTSFTPNATWNVAAEARIMFCDPTATQNAINSMEAANTVIQQAEVPLNQAIAADQAIETSLDNLDTALKAGIASATQKAKIAFGKESLPDAFADAILNHYMKNQEKYLELLALLLSSSNDATGIMNTLMNELLNFSEAGGNYGFNQFMAGQKQNSDGTYNGNGQDAQTQINNEQNNCQNDINSATKAIKEIDKELAEIQKKLDAHPPQIDKATAKKLEKQLKGTKADLGKALDNLHALQKEIGGPNGQPPQPGITITANSNGTYTVNYPPGTNLSTVTTLENNVINGNPSGAAGGGLSAIYTNLTTDQGGWTSQSTQQQLTLQMRMTQIQQEWSVVSTAMQMLNQMYMTVAQAIYK